METMEIIWFKPTAQGSQIEQVAQDQVQAPEYLQVEDVLGNLSQCLTILRVKSVLFFFPSRQSLLYFRLCSLSPTAFLQELLASLKSGSYTQ